MPDLKLLNKRWVDGFLIVIEPLAKVLINLRVHPHYLTFSGLVFSLLAFNFFRNGFLFYGGIMVILAGICDVLDGRLARDTQKMSKYGALIDSVVDRYSEVLIYMGLAVFFWRESALMIILLILTIAGSFLVSYTRARAEALGFECKIGLMQRQERITYLAAGAIFGSIPYTRHIFLTLSIWIIAILSNVTVIQRVWHIRNKMKESEIGS
jgi:CDP-diacylglycerol--glycerol-3-phosphate 3-phosphatidyltransferase